MHHRKAGQAPSANAIPGETTPDARLSPAQPEDSFDNDAARRG